MFNVTTTIDDAKIAGLLCTGFEGGSYGVGYWCRIMDHRKPQVIKPVMDPEGGEVWKNYDYPLLEGGAVICRRFEEETDEEYTPLVLDRAAIERGLKVMSEKYTKHFTDFMTDEGDACTGDVFIQCCLLGDVEYG